MIAAMCWPVTIQLEATPCVPVDKRRLECWQRFLARAHLQVWVHPPNAELGDDHRLFVFR